MVRLVHLEQEDKMVSLEKEDNLVMMDNLVSLEKEEVQGNQVHLAPKDYLDLQGSLVQQVNLVKEENKVHVDKMANQVHQEKEDQVVCLDLVVFQGHLASLGYQERVDHKVLLVNEELQENAV